MIFDRRKSLPLDRKNCFVFVLFKSRSCDLRSSVSPAKEARQRAETNGVGLLAGFWGNSAGLPKSTEERSTAFWCISARLKFYAIQLALYFQTVFHPSSVLFRYISKAGVFYISFWAFQCEKKSTFVLSWTSIVKLEQRPLEKGRITPITQMLLG